MIKKSTFLETDTDTFRYQIFFELKKFQNKNVTLWPLPFRQMLKAQIDFQVQEREGDTQDGGTKKKQLGPWRCDTVSLLLPVTAFSSKCAPERWQAPNIMS